MIFTLFKVTQESLADPTIYILTTSLPSKWGLSAVTCFVFLSFQRKFPNMVQDASTKVENIRL